MGSSWPSIPPISSAATREKLALSNQDFLAPRKDAENIIFRFSRLIFFDTPKHLG